MSELRFTRREAWFWRVERPLEMKFAAEKATRMLLFRDPADPGTLVLAGTSSSKDPEYHARLCLQSVDPERHLYSLHMEASASAKWFTQEKLDQMADRAWHSWTSAWRIVPQPQPLLRDQSLYQRAVRDALSREGASANRKEDDAPLAAARQAVLDALRAGKRCVECNKEGVTTFRFAAGEFSRDHIGDWQESQVFVDGDAILADLRQFYDWDTKRETYPHSPPEVEVWQYILRRMS